MDEDIKVPSNDLKELAETVNLNIPAPSGRYEIFTTPESGGAVPGPTDYATLVAELDTSSGAQPVSEGTIPNIWLVSNANRSWLPENFQAILKKYAGDKFSPTTPGCSAIKVQLAQSKREVYGFQCIAGSKTLVYVPLMTGE